MALKRRMMFSQRQNQQLSLHERYHRYSGVPMGRNESAYANTLCWWYKQPTSHQRRGYTAARLTRVRQIWIPGATDQWQARLGLFAYPHTPEEFGPEEPKHTRSSVMKLEDVA